jgi:hypothetical protein
MPFGIGSCVFGTYEKDLGRVINPYQNDEQSASCSITRRDTAASDIKSDQGLLLVRRTTQSVYVRCVAQP